MALPQCALGLSASQDKKRAKYETSAQADGETYCERFITEFLRTASGNQVAVIRHDWAHVFAVTIVITAGVAAAAVAAQFATAGKGAFGSDPSRK